MERFAVKMLLGLLLVLSVSGCGILDRVQGPRELTKEISQPVCVILCVLFATINNQEGSKIGDAHDVSINKPISTSKTATIAKEPTK